MSLLRERMIQDMKIRNLAERTQETYVSQVAKFAKHFKKSPEDLGVEEIRQYQLYLIESGSSWSVFNQTVAALRFLYLKTLKKEWTLEQIPYPKQPKKLPIVLSTGEVFEFLESIKNYKHRVILTTIYGAGLRLNEATHLKTVDIDSKRMVIRVDQGKGMKDRYVMLSERLLELLREYYSAFRPKGPYLFPSQRDPNKAIGDTPVQKMFSKTLNKLGWKKPVSVRTLRHCFATHLLEAGMNIRTIQEMMGHRSLETTQIYLHISVQQIGQLRSPLDILPVLKKN